MTNSKTTKGALFTSSISLLLCFAMLLGTTFAWFTDSVTSAGNVIQAGTLDVDLVDDAGNSMAGEVIEFVAADGRAQSEILWEPGCTYKTEPVYVVNNGNLALKYEIAINGITGNAKLLEAIEWTVTVGGNKTAIADLKGTLSAGAKSEAIVLSGHMKEEAGNEYQDLSVSGISITVFATQLEAEKDSFGPNYDKEAEYDDVVVFKPEELASALTSNEKYIEITLANDIDVPMSSLGTQTPGSGEYKLGGENTEAIIINLNGNKMTITTTYMSAIGAKNDDATIIIKNGSMNSIGNSSKTWNINDLIFANCNYEFNNVTFDKEVALTNTGKNVKMNNVTINGTGDYYALWIQAEGQNVSIDGLTINTPGRGIKIDEQYSGANVEKVTLNVSNSKFTTAKKAAIMVKSAKGAAITVNNVDIADVTADTLNTVWVDSDAKDYADLVTVTGGSVITEN